MGALNHPRKGAEVPEPARGNPVYEQTRQDMPLWCCGRNCGRNSRVTVFVLGTIGIFASSIACLSPNYFHFISFRDDTFTDPENYQPVPFTYATEANVGLFRYQILEFYEYTWPDLGYEERKLFDEMHNRELERLASFDLKDGDSSIFSRLLQKRFPDEFYDDDDSVTNDGDGDGGDNDTGDDDEFSIPSGNITTYQNDTMDIVLTKAPADSPTEIPIDQIPDVLPGSNAKNRLPTSTPTPQPTQSNPNENYDLEDIGKVQSYRRGNELDKLFNNGRSGALWAPILAAIGLIFASIEFFCCVYKCSWLPTAISLYIAFMLQMMTLFLFMSDDFCNYRQDCVLGSAGFMSVIAVICYFICQILVCMTPRPPPKYDLLKKPPVRRKKKKKKRPKEFADDDDEKEGLADQDRFADESSYNNDSSRYLDPYDDQDPYNNHYGDNNGYGKGYDNGNNNGYDNGNNNGYNDGYNDGYNEGYDQDGYNNGYDNHDGGYDNTDQNGYDKADQKSYDDADRRDYDNGDQKSYGDENADQRGYDNDEPAYDDQDSAAQRSHDNDAQMDSNYNEDNEEVPSSTSSKPKKKKKKKKG